MKKSRLLGAACACLAIVSFNASAAIVSVDWQAANDDLITQETGSGLEWLDLTVTAGRSYSDISSKFGTGQEFDGWRYATETEIAGLFDAFGGNNAYYNEWSTQNNGLFAQVAPYWGDIYCIVNTCTIGEGYSRFILSDVPSTGLHSVGRIYDANPSNRATLDLVQINTFSQLDTGVDAYTGSALVRNITTVPVPTAIWLFGSGLLGLIGVAKRKAT